MLHFQDCTSACLRVCESVHAYRFFLFFGRLIHFECAVEVNTILFWGNDTELSLTHTQTHDEELYSVFEDGTHAAFTKNVTKNFIACSMMEHMQLSLKMSLK